jgi:hypothetical protein
LWEFISLPFAAALSSGLGCCGPSFAAALSCDLGCCGRSILFPLLLRSLMTSVIVGAHLFPFAATLSCGLGCCGRSFLFPLLLRSLMTSVIVGARYFSLRSCAQFWSRLLWALNSLPFAAALSSDLGCCGRSLLFPSQLRSVVISVVVGVHFSSLRSCAQL